MKDIKIKSRNYIGLGILVLLVAVSIVLDLRQGSYWDHHAFLTGLSAGFATLGITILGIDNLIELRSSRRWRFVADVAYRGLARESRDVCATFASLYCDIGYEMESAYKDENFRRDQLSPLGEIRNLLAGKDAIASFSATDFPALPSNVNLRLPEERIRYLLNDKNWVLLAYEEVARLVDVNRETVAKWATLLMNSKESREELNTFSSLNDGIFRLAFELQRFSVDENEARIEEIWKLFVINDSKARFLTNHLWHLAGEEYKFSINENLQSLELEAVFANENLLLINY